MKLEDLTKMQLLAKCEELGITKCKSKNKNKLIELINNFNHPIIEIETELELETDIQIINNDCMLELIKLQDNSIDCVITDPPYFIDKLNNKWNASDIKNDVKNSHITHLPKGMKFDKSQVKNLYDYYLELSKIARGVATQRIHPEQIYDLEIPLPDIKTQKEFLSKINSLENNEVESIANT